MSRSSRVALLTIATLALSGLTAVAPVAADTSTDEPDLALTALDVTPAAYYPLDADVADAVGGYHGTTVGTVTYDDGLTLTGGSSSGPYVTLPADVITDQGEDLTISAWIRRDVANGNYAALFFGTPPVNGLPSNYWLLNPSQPQGYFKSVVTDSTNPTAPWGTEVGPSGASNSVSAAGLRYQWAQYTTVITEDSIRGYLNGVPVGPAVAKSLRIEDFAGSLSVMIGKSNYTGDHTYGGAYRHLRVFDEALDADQVATLYAGDVDAPEVAPQTVSVSTVGDEVRVQWSAAPAASGLRPVSGYRIVLTETTTAATIVAEVSSGTLQHTFAEVPDGTYEAAVAAVNPAGAGPATTAPASVTVDTGLDPAEEDLGALVIPNAAAIRGNITLPAAGAIHDSAITWSASPAGVITTTADGEIAAGVVTRGAVDQTVVLTAASGDHSRDITVTVKAAEPQDEYAAYLFTYFNGEGGPAGESVRLAVSEGADALSWHDLNDGEAVLSSMYGTLGVRDPFIIRSPEGDTFYLLATDLNTDGVNFARAQTHGSRYLEIWESTDLVNWSNQRHVEVSSEYAGNTWAPEAFYDDSLEAYLVFWASNLYETTDLDSRDNTDSYNRMMYSITRDFVTFTEPQVWIDSERREGGFGMIDSSVIREGDTYYRFTKDEGTMRVLLDRSEHLRATITHDGIGESFTATGDADEWSLVTRDIGDGQSYVNPAGTASTFSQGEGPTIFRSIADPAQWYLFIDQPSYHGGQGYAAMTSTDRGESWVVLDSSGLPSSPRHGTVTPITRAEYDRVLAAYQDDLLVTGVESFDIDVALGATGSAALPATVTATFGNDSGRTEQIAVEWEEHDLAELTAVGQQLTVRGWLADGSATPAVATFTAVAAGAAADGVEPVTDRAAIRVGDTEQVRFAATDGATLPGDVEWTSSVPAVASISASGLLTAHAPGDVTITATAGTWSADLVIEVVDVADDLLLRYDFEGLSTTDAGARIVDRSGRGLDGSLHGTGAQLIEGPDEEGNGSALRLPGGAASSSAAWVSLPTGVLADSDDVTLTAWVQRESTTACQWIASLGETSSRNAYLFASPSCGGTARNGVKVGATENLANATALPQGQWAHLALVLEGGSSLTVFVDGEQVATTATAHVASALAAVASPYGGTIGKSSYSADPYFGGVVDDLRVYGSALDAERIAAIIEGTDGGDPAPDPEDVAWVEQARTALLDIPAFSAEGAQNVRGNLFLPTTLAEIQGRQATDGAETVSIAWQSSDTEVVTDADVLLGATTEGVADVIAAGAVTRGAGDAEVTLTATISRGSHSVEVPIELTVLADPGVEFEDFEAYMFAYFTGNTTAGQQIYFAASDGNDALAWTELNDGAPALTSSEGTGGLRDPAIVRSAEGDRFFLLATDLDITTTTWPEAYTDGSLYLEIWESTDLVNWSSQRHVQVSEEWAGMTWAPEAYWDEAIGAYVVFWSSRVYPEGEPHVTDAPGTETSRIIAVTTRDFVHFSEPFVWVDAGDRIDSAVFAEDGVYYRVTKEVTGQAGCADLVTDASTELRARYLDYDESGAWTTLESCVARNAGYSPVVEGPTIFRANAEDVHGQGYYLFADYFSGSGYQAFWTDDIGEPGWIYLDPASDDRVSLPPSPRHGSVINITRAERDALLGAYQDDLLVTSVEPVELEVPAGSAGQVVLPATVTAAFGADGDRTEQVAVSWEEHDLSSLTAVGQQLTVLGRLADGSATPAVATLTAVTSPAPVTTIELDAPTGAVTTGGELAVTASILPAGSAGTGELTWSVSDPRIATVSADGVVTGLTPGHVAVTAEAGGVLGTIALEVVPEHTGLLLWYDVDDRVTGEPGSTLVDRSGRGLDGLITGTGATTVAGPRGTDDLALSLPGGTSTSNAAHVVIPGGLIPADTQDVTLVTQLWWDGQRGCEWIAGLGQSSARYLFASPSCGGTLRAGVKSGLSEHLATGPLLSSGRWAQVAVVLEGGQAIRAYVDGVLVGERDTEYVASQVSSAIGARSGFIGRSFYADPLFGGDIAEVQVYSGALDATALAQLAAEGGVVADVVPFAPGGIEIDALPDTVVYQVGDSFDPAGLRVLAQFPGVTSDVTSEAVLSGFDSSAPGEVTVTVTVTLAGEDFTATFPVTIQGEPLPGPVLHYDFSQQDAGGDSSATVTDISGNGNHGVVVGEPQWNDSTFVFTRENHVELPDDLLAHAESASVTVEVKPDSRAFEHFGFLWNIGGLGGDQSVAQGQWFAAIHAGFPRTAITPTNWSQEQQARGAADTIEAGLWYSLTSVIDGDAGTLTLYVDGVQVAQTTGVTISPSDLSAHTRNLLGASAYPDDTNFSGEIAEFRVYDRAITPAEATAVSEAYAQQALDSVIASLDGAVPARVAYDLALPDRFATWASSNPAVIGDDGSVQRPEAGEGDVEVTLTAQVTVRGATGTFETTVTVLELPGDPGYPYGYLIAHFVEDPDGYAEKVYLSLSDGDDPTTWRQLNDAEPVLASDLGTTGIRDPYLVQNPETGVYYMIATDLRVFGGTGDWGIWQQHGSRDLVIWSSEDLVNWSEPWLLEVAPESDETGMGMAWAPEATWDEASGQFIVYFSSRIFDLESNPNRSFDADSYTRVVYGTTTDFATDYEYQGVMIDRGHDVIDTTVIQHEGRTYRLSKDNGGDDALYHEYTDHPQWWTAEAEWTVVATRIGQADYGNVEGPLVFKDHHSDRWYLFVDQYGSAATQGYRPYTTTDLSSGQWTRVPAAQFDMFQFTKHGVVIPLTLADYERLSDADVIDVAEVRVSTPAGVTPALPDTVEVSLGDGRTQERGVTWDVEAGTDIGGSAITGVVLRVLTTLTGADLQAPGVYTVQGVIDGDQLARNHVSGGVSSEIFATAVVTVTAPVATGVQVTSLPAKVRYEMGEVFDPAGLVVSAVYSDASTAPLSEDEYVLTGFDSATPGQKTVTVSAELEGQEFTTSFTVTVAEGEEPGPVEPTTEEPTTEEPTTPGGEEPTTGEPTSPGTEPTTGGPTSPAPASPAPASPAPASPSPTAPGTDQPGMPGTGAQIGGALAVAVVLVLLGGFAVRRRRTGGA